jgi:hypothetical protein
MRSASSLVRAEWRASRKNAGLSRESFYKALGERGNPEFATIMRGPHGAQQAHGGVGRRDHGAAAHVGLGDQRGCSVGVDVPGAVPDAVRCTSPAEPDRRLISHDVPGRPGTAMRRCSNRGA